jgi:hypothetical protein
MQSQGIAILKKNIAGKRSNYMEQITHVVLGREMDNGST